MIGSEYVVPYVNSFRIILTTHDGFQVLRITIRSEEVLTSNLVMYSKKEQFDPELLEQLGEIERRDAVK